MKLKGSEAIVKVLLEQGVDTVFGYPGGAVIPLYDALYDAPLKNVLTAHEQGAIHAADGYAVRAAEPAYVSQPPVPVPQTLLPAWQLLILILFRW